MKESIVHAKALSSIGKPIVIGGCEETMVILFCLKMKASCAQLLNYSLPASFYWDPY